jgi:hypothetical protein
MIQRYCSTPRAARSSARSISRTESCTMVVG